MSQRNSMESRGDVEAAVTLLRSGGLVAFPTETVYGLGADATNPRAVAKIFEVKNRPRFDPLIVHLASTDELRRYVTSVPPQALRLAEQAWPGPLTMILPRQSVIPDLVTAGLPGVGIRVPRHPVALELLRRSELPLAAPSANPFTGISPTTAAHVQNGLGDSVDLILDGGPCEVGLESTVLSFMEDTPSVLRPGGCSIEDIESIIGPVRHSPDITSSDESPKQSPGQLSRHYAPRTPMYLVDREETAVALTDRSCGLLTEGTRSAEPGFVRRIDLAADGDLVSCAAAFFAALRSLDESGLDVIMAHRFPDHGLGIALNDRLQRAAVK